MSNGVNTGVWTLNLDDLLMEEKAFKQPDSTLPSSPPLPQAVPPARTTRELAQPRPIVIDVEENEFLDAPTVAQPRPEIAALVTQARGRRRKNPPKRTDDYKKNITRDSLHRIAREIEQDVTSKRIISYKLGLLDIDYSEF